jgi:hypothetical protein
VCARERFLQDVTIVTTNCVLANSPIGVNKGVSIAHLGNDAYMRGVLLIETPLFRESINFTDYFE